MGQEKDPSNIYVADAEYKGINQVMTLHEKTPPSICTWIKNCHNKFHDGFQASFVHIAEERGARQGVRKM